MSLRYQVVPGESSVKARREGSASPSQAIATPFASLRPEPLDNPVNPAGIAIVQSGEAGHAASFADVVVYDEIGSLQREEGSPEALRIDAERALYIDLQERAVAEAAYLLDNLCSSSFNEILFLFTETLPSSLKCRDVW